MSTIYWITRVDAVMCVIFLMALAIITVLVYSKIEETVEEDKEIMRPKTKKKLCFALCFCVLLLVFIPSKKEIYEMYAISGTLEYVRNNKDAQKIPDKLVKFINAWLDENTKDENSK